MIVVGACYLCSVYGGDFVLVVGLFAVGMFGFGFLVTVLM